jgi:hypothetical protein
MNSLVSLILAVFFLAGCGRQSNPIPETKDSYPRTYPKEDASDTYQLITRQLNPAQLVARQLESTPNSSGSRYLYPGGFQYVGKSADQDAPRVGKIKDLPVVPEFNKYGK